MTRIIDSIFCLYILLLLVIPCCAFDHCASDNINNSTLIADAHKPDDKDGCGNCSPFSFCQGCNGCINSLKVAEIKTQLIIDISAKEYNSYQVMYFPRYFVNIWQPPKRA